MGVDLLPLISGCLLPSRQGCPRVSPAELQLSRRNSRTPLPCSVMSRAYFL